MKHFTRSEFACKCGCGFDTIDYTLVEIAEAVRSHFGNPVRVSSGCRCAKHNKFVGGKPRTSKSAGSQHLYGRAADLVVRGIPAKMVSKWIKENFPEASVGTYNSFTHVDSRTDGPKYW